MKRHIDKLGALGLFLVVALFILIISVGSSTASAAPVAYTEYGDTTVVLTDSVDQSICPVGTYIAVAQAGQQKIVGCWAADEGNVHILWLAPHTLPKSAFQAVEPDMKA